MPTAHVGDVVTVGEALGLERFTLVGQSMGAHTAADWLPHAPATRCDMVTRQIEVKAQWNLTVTARERAAMQQVLAGCDETA